MGRDTTSECTGQSGRFRQVWPQVAPFMELAGPRSEGILVPGQTCGSGRFQMGVSGIQMDMRPTVIHRGAPLQSMDGAFLPPQFRGIGYEEERSTFYRAKGSCVTRRDAATKMMDEPARSVRAKSFTLEATCPPWRERKDKCTATGTLA